MKINARKRKKYFSIFLSIFISLSIIFGIIQFIRFTPTKELISTETYDIYEITTKDQTIYFTFIDDCQKINKMYYPHQRIFRMLYLGEKNQVTIEKWEYNGKVKKTKVTKFYLDEKTYKKFSQEFKW